MAKLKIFKFPDFVLTQKAKPIDRIEKGDLKMAEDMLETMYAAPGVGLAANQVGILKRMLVLDTDFDIEDEDNEGDEDRDEMREARSGEVSGTRIITNKNPRMIFNPEIIYREGEILFAEGCLSVPGYTADVKRAEKIKLQYQDEDGTTKVLPADGLLAVAIQHELDHLDGKLFIERLSSLKKEMAVKKLKREREKREKEIAKRLAEGDDE